MCDRTCHICIGCGRCAGTRGDLSVLTRSPLPGEGISLKNRDKKRLVAVDIGTTTIAMQFFGEEGSVEDEFVTVNPQVKYGADVISRIQAAQKPDAALSLKQMVRETLSRGLEQFRQRLKEGESLFMVIAANTTMVYLLMGYDTKELGQAPFAAGHLETAHVVVDGVSGVVLPGLSAFVGGDITAGLYACRAAEREELTLFLDLGTNGEIALGNCRRMIACATAAGPAFEGGVNRGIWGADMIRLLAGLRREGIVDETGLMTDPYFDEGIMIGGVRVTQEAVRAVQLAKGAILAGIRILTKQYGVKAGQIEQVVLAGGFGYYLDPVCAAEIGILPESLAGRTRAGGNTALAGALRAGGEILRMGDPGGIPETDYWRDRGCETQVLNLAAQREFEELYLQSMELRAYE